MEVFSLLIIVSIGGFLVWDKMQSKKESGFSADSERMKFELDQKTAKVGELESLLEASKKEVSELSGKGKEVYVQKISLEEKTKALQDRIDVLNKDMTKAEADRDRKEKEFNRQLNELENSRKALEDEKIRIRREDEERLAQEEANRDRIWNEHETSVLTHMKEVCQKPDIAFSYYENTQLPESFTGRFKPDFLVDFMGQYVIFDAKMTRSASLQNYIREQVKKTAEKIKAAKNKDEIYGSVFFIVPTIGIEELKQTHFYEEGYNFFVISVEAFEPILHSLKRITHYELAENFDPKERENIINLLASYDYHINWQNAVNILSSAKSLQVLQEKDNLTPDMREGLELTKNKMRTEGLKVSDIKRLTMNEKDQAKELKKFIEPQQPLISEEDLGNAT